MSSNSTCVKIMCFFMQKFLPFTLLYTTIVSTAIFYHLIYHCSIRQEAFAPKREVEIMPYIPRDTTGIFFNAHCVCDI